MSTPSASSQRRRGVLSIVEHGWRGARECSLALNERAIPVTHLIKGWLAPDVRPMIQPYPHIRIVSTPRLLFWFQLWSMLVWQTLSGRLRWLLIDHERTLWVVSWWCRLFRLTPVWIAETDAGYMLSRRRAPVSFDALFGNGHR